MVLPEEVTSPVKFALVVAVTPVNPEPLPENPLALKIPVLGTNDNLPIAVFCGKSPVLAVTKVGKTAVAVLISLVMAVLVAFAASVAVVALPVVL